MRHCDACKRHKVNTRMYAGKLRPLSIPRRRWESVSMDLIVKLPTTADGHDSILVFVDRLSKMVHLVPTTESLNARSFAALFVNNVVRSHGLPATSYQIVGRNSTTFGHTSVSCWAWIRGCPALFTPKQMDRWGVRIACWNRCVELT